VCSICYFFFSLHQHPGGQQPDPLRKDVGQCHLLGELLGGIVHAEAIRQSGQVCKSGGELTDSLDSVRLGPVCSRSRMRMARRSSWTQRPGPGMSAATALASHNVGLERRRERTDEGGDWGLICKSVYIL
jgi:hypothetical protein